MRKTDKKIENQLRTELTNVCESALKNIDGFLWLTHLVNYSNFPSTLKVICVFDSLEHVKAYKKLNVQRELETNIERTLVKFGVSLKQAKNHIFFDTEESCNLEHNGNWALRLKQQ